MKYEEIVKQFQNNIFGTLTTIRSSKDKNKIWFLGAEIKQLLGHSNLTQSIIDAKLRPEEKFILLKTDNPNFFYQLTKQSLVGYGKRSSSITFISESGLYKLIMRSNKAEAEKFANWVTSEVLPKLRESVEESIKFNKMSADVEKHLDIEHQKYESKRINGININRSGVAGAINYNRQSCLDHSGMTPRKLKIIAEKNGIPASKRTSGKEVLRQIDMPTACSMSFTDSLVSDGIPYNKALRVSNNTGKELFKQLIEIGARPKELDK